MCFCGIYVICCSCCCIGLLYNNLVPVALNSPIKDLIREDLPAPFGPMIPIISPRTGIDKEMFLITCLLPKTDLNLLFLTNVYTSN